METLLAGTTASFLPAKLLPARPDTAMVADAAAIAVDGGAQNLRCWELAMEMARSDARSQRRKLARAQEKDTQACFLRSPNLRGQEGAVAYGWMLKTWEPQLKMQSSLPFGSAPSVAPATANSHSISSPDINCGTFTRTEA